MLGTKGTTSIKKRAEFDSIEVVKDIGDSIRNSLVKDVAEKGVNDLWKQLLGSKENTHSTNHGDLHEGQEIDFRSHVKKERSHAEAGINYSAEIIHTETRKSKETSGEIAVLVEQIVIELKEVMKQSKELQTTYKELAAPQVIEKAGEYHINFFSFMLQMVRRARMQIEDSAAWLGAMKSKKGEGGYWNQFKKQGTSFGLSNERSVATQTG